MVFAFLAVVEPLLGLATNGACPDMLSYRIPYSSSGRNVISDFVLDIPATRLDFPWLKLDTTPRAGPAGAVLKRLLSAIYDNQPNRLSDVVDAKLVKRFGGMTEYVAAFRKSLVSAGQLNAVAVVPVPGSLGPNSEVHFLLKGEAEEGYRLFAFRLVNQAYIYTDVTMDPVTSLELAVFRVGVASTLPPIKAADAIRVPLTADTDPCAPIFSSSVLRFKGPLEPKSTGNAVISFLAGCRYALEEGRLEAFLSCLIPDRATQFRELISNLSADKRAQFMRSQLDIRGEALLLIGGNLNTVFFRRPAGTGEQGIAHFNVVRSPNSSFELVDSFTSGVLDAVLDTKEFRSAVSRMIH